MVATKFIVVITSQYIHVSNYFCTPESNIKLMQNISQYKPSPKRKWEDLTNLAVLSTQSELTKSVEVKSLSHVWLLATPWTVAHQAPLSKGFSRQESWSGLPFPSPGDLPNPGIEPRSPTLQADALTSEPPGKHNQICKWDQITTLLYFTFCSFYLIVKEATTPMNSNAGLPGSPGSHELLDPPAPSLKATDYRTSASPQLPADGQCRACVSTSPQQQGRGIQTHKAPIGKGSLEFYMSNSGWVCGCSSYLKLALLYLTFNHRNPEYQKHMRSHVLSPQANTEDHASIAQGQADWHHLQTGSQHPSRYRSVVSPLWYKV